MFHVYIDRTTEDESRVFYVGKGKQNKLSRVYRNAKHSNVVAKHGIQRDIIMTTSDEDVAFELEKMLIAENHTYIADLLADSIACNFTLGGEGASGSKHSKETRAKISKGLCGRPVSDETRAKIGEANSGKIFTNEHRKKLSESHKGKSHWVGLKHSEETKAKMRASHLGKGVKSVQQLDIDTGAIIKTFSSIAAAAKSMNVSHSSIAQVSAKNGVFRGYLWRRVAPVKSKESKEI